MYDNVKPNKLFDIVEWGSNDMPLTTQEIPHFQQGCVLDTTVHNHSNEEIFICIIHIVLITVDTNLYAVIYALLFLLHVVIVLGSHCFYDYSTVTEL